MRARLTVPDLLAFAVMAILVAVAGTGLGVAAAHGRSHSPSEHGPIRVIIHPGNDVPSIQRDRFQLERPRR
jgi:hypothetical protein